jgi:hypothetical protein
MRSLISLWIMSAAVVGAQDFRLSGPAPGWANVLRSLGMVATSSPSAKVVVATDPSNTSELQDQLAAGAVLVIEGHSALALSLGIEPMQKKVELRQIRDVASPELPIVWQNAVAIEIATLRAGWNVRAKDRWSEAPILAICKVGKGAVLWTATPIGDSGFDRYPFLPQALLAAGLEPQVRGKSLWAFFDAGFRLRADLAYLVSQWKAAGIGAIHVTSWQFDDAAPERAKWLESLIALCHENLIQVYAWVELPHVSEAFWQRYPKCREKTATGMDASLDWRRLMNLVDPQCSEFAELNIMALLRRFEWDGVNLGELYFESLEGHDNPARFTPINDAVRSE